ncbi:MAG: electron transfer flavoprotein subunit beta/FixA family protein [Deltaproteobacteria bacterium]|nr:electron transfer flavoprotein subunit beta/FixA family protein [Deltaproteobacteria bacterium]
MKIIVILKQVPDSETKIKVKGDGSGIETDGIKYVISPYDEYAVEEALKLKEKAGGDSTVTVVSAGPDRTVESIRTALAMGADAAVHVNDPALEGADSLGVARALAKAIQDNGFDIIFAGKQGIDQDNSQVPSAVAELLDIPQVNIIAKFEITEDKSKATVSRRIEGGEETIETSLPALFGCEKGLNEPRYASLPGIMKAKKKPVKTVDLAGLGLDAGEVGAAGSHVKILKWIPLPERQAGKILQGMETAEASKELVRLLREEAKVI